MISPPPRCYKARLGILGACLIAFGAGCSESPGVPAGSAEDVLDASTSVPAAPASNEAEHGHDASESDTLTGIDFLGDYVLVDEVFGTEVTVSIANGVRTMMANALPNHRSGEFPNDGNPHSITEQTLSYEFTTAPVYLGTVTPTRVPGVALNGVSMEPGTAETATCANGETYRIEALQDFLDLGLDMNNAHVQPGGKYHYHGRSDLLVDAFDQGDDLVLVGFAADGHLIYASVSDAYASSYGLTDDVRSGTNCVHTGRAGVSVDLEGTVADGTYVGDWVFIDGSGDLDECNGTFIDGNYAYLVTADYPYIPRCLMGNVEGDVGRPAPGDDRPPDAPDLADAAAALGVTEAELVDLLPPPGEPLDDAAAALGVTVDELRQILPPPPGR